MKLPDPGVPFPIIWKFSQEIRDTWVDCTSKVRFSELNLRGLGYHQMKIQSQIIQKR